MREATDHELAQVEGGNPILWGAFILVIALGILMIPCGRNGC